MPAEKVTYFTVDAHQDGQRVDNVLLRYYRKVPKTRIYRAIRKGEVRVDKKRVKPTYRLTAGQQVRVPPIQQPEQMAVTVSASSIDWVVQRILFEDDELLVLNKPSGIAVHGGSGVSYGVIEALRQRYPKHQFLELIHRLDRDTSGLLMVAKKPQLLRSCHELLRQGKVNKHYQLLVSGQWPETLTVVDQPIKKDLAMTKERRMIVDPTGKSALTEFEVIERYATATRLRAKLCTGRTHQLRVHTAYHRHPIIGDRKYGDFLVNAAFEQRGLNRLFLHAEDVSFQLPDYPTYRFFAELPSQLADLVAGLRR